MCVISNTMQSQSTKTVNRNAALAVGTKELKLSIELTKELEKRFFSCA